MNEAMKEADQRCDARKLAAPKPSGPLSKRIKYSTGKDRRQVDMTVGMREALQYADQYSPSEIAAIALELDYLYEFDELPPGAVMLVKSERQQGGVWVIVWPEPEAWQ